MKLRQLIRRPINKEELIAQVSFYRFLAFGLALHTVGVAAALVVGGVIDGR